MMYHDGILRCTDRKLAVVDKAKNSILVAVPDVLQSSLNVIGWSLHGAHVLYRALNGGVVLRATFICCVTNLIPVEKEDFSPRVSITIDTACLVCLADEMSRWHGDSQCDREGEKN